jgi:hypothetical protein
MLILRPSHLAHHGDPLVPIDGVIDEHSPIVRRLFKQFYGAESVPQLSMSK